MTFGLVHGAWHGAWCWKKLIPLLQAGGHQVVTMDLPITKLSANFDTYADTVADALDGYENIVLVGHSRAGNVIPRVPSRIPVQGLIYLGAAISKAADFVIDPAAEVPKQMGKGYNAGIILRPDGLTEYDSKLTEYYFYYDCEPVDTAWAISQLRPQNRADDAPEIPSQPAIPTDSIICTGDRIRNPEWARYAAQAYLGVTATEFPSGHSPFISHPKLLAKTLLDITARQQALTI